MNTYTAYLVGRGAQRHYWRTVTLVLTLLFGVWSIGLLKTSVILFSIACGFRDPFNVAKL